jgi:CP family cyanate transporter-like MFS transporter
LIMGGSSSLYFAANAFLPDYLHLLGRVGAIAPTLSAMSLLQIGAPLLVLASPGHFVGRRVPFIISGIAALTCVGAILIGRGEKIVLAAALLGFSTALILTISLTLPALLAAPEQVHRVSAGMFAIAYGCATIYPVLGGILWDLTRIPELAFAPGMAGMALGIVLSFAVNLQPARALNGQPATGNGRRA